MIASNRIEGDRRLSEEIPTLEEIRRDMARRRARFFAAVAGTVVALGAAAVAVGASAGKAVSKSKKIKKA